MSNKFKVGDEVRVLSTWSSCAAVKDGSEGVIKEEDSPKTYRVEFPREASSTGTRSIAFSQTLYEKELELVSRQSAAVAQADALDGISKLLREGAEASEKLAKIREILGV